MKNSFKYTRLLMGILMLAVLLAPLANSYANEADDYYLPKFKQNLFVGMSVNAENIDYNTMLTISAEAGALKTVEFLVRKGADINKTDGSDYTALMHTVWGGELKIAEFLLKRGADTEIVDTLGIRALHLAVYYSKPRLVKLFLNNGAYVNAKVKGETKQKWYPEKLKFMYGKTPLGIARALGETEIISILKKAGAK